MKYINLIEQLSDLDKKRLENFITTYGINKKDFIGLDEWLQPWSHANQKLYRLLGNSLIKEVPFTYEKTEKDIIEEVRSTLLTSTFRYSYHAFFQQIIVPLAEQDIIATAERRAFSAITDVESFVADEIPFGIKYKKAGSKKTLQLQKGMKPIRALSKIVEYFKDDFNFEGFENFRILHSMILNDKIVKGTMCFSIHPLDYLTMSDNNSNWSSCMSWQKAGCYHIGTVEMMTSNNVLCCYLCAKNTFNFSCKNNYVNNYIESPEWEWNNKKWRVLCYAMKDIIMAGKAYPYKNEEFNKFVISTVKDLAKENLNWTYSFGPELYKDMIHISNGYRMDNNRKWIKYGHTTKHNILFDTKGMYNDMLNDNRTHYWCYRNKVDHNKIISISGKAPCLCCGGSVIEETDAYYDEYDYNDRYRNCDTIVCGECLENYFCECCHERDPIINLYKIRCKGDSLTAKVCDICFSQRVKICPCCGEPFFIHEGADPIGYILPDKPQIFGDTKNIYEFRNFIPSDWLSDRMNNKEEITKINNKYHQGIYICEDCIDKFNLTMDYFPHRKYWNSTYDILCVIPQEAEEAKKYRYTALKSIPAPEDSTKVIEIKGCALPPRKISIGVS